MNLPLQPSVQLDRQLEVSTRSNPLWFKNALVYEAHVKAFHDSNNDGVGDFEGMRQKLDYLQDLGITALWLLPFYPSPLKDDGYDIAKYRGIHPAYGTMRDFRRLVRACHDRGIRVITELVINHTSDQHPWFQRARRAKPGSAARDFYVWSDTDQKYKDARIIFTDTEKSNWTWDPVAKAYYWHRFYSHQPDLNFDNPQAAGRDHPRHALLARHGGGRAAAGRHPLSDRARGHQLREPARDPRRDQEDPGGDRRQVSRPHAAGRGQPVAGRRLRLFRPAATNATCASTSR